MFCNHCGKQIPDNSSVCSFCGTPITQAAPQVMFVNQSMPVTSSNIPAVSDKEWLTALLLEIFLGSFGIHRFYVGKGGTGILWLFSFGLFGIGWLVDLIMIVTGSFRDCYGRPLKK